MTDNNLKNILQKAFDDYELQPADDSYQHIQERLQQQYNQKDAKYRYAKYALLGILLLTLGLGTWGFLQQNSQSTAKQKNIAASQNLTASNTQALSATDIANTQPAKATHTSLKPTETGSIIALNNEKDEKPTNNNANLLDNSILLSSAKNVKVFEKKHSYTPKNKIDRRQKISDSNFENTDTKPDFALSGTSNIAKQKQNFIATNQTDITDNKIDIEPNTAQTAENLPFYNLHLLSNHQIKLLQNYLAHKSPPIKLKTTAPAKELPKINKNTPLAIQIGFTPFYAFQHITPTAQGYNNIQNIAIPKGSTSERLGYNLNLGYVLNWTRRSRLRLGLNYRNIYQKVSYEKATDIYEFQQVNNQTILVRKGTPYSEQKRNDMVGFHADRQFFMQLSTPTRLYASLGADYSKLLGSRSQLLFLNTSMGLDHPIATNWRIQIEPSYAYGVLGTTDSPRNLKINPNHLGLKIGIMYEIRK
jgi:hypothetical protein